jgi:hypothetical protein
MSGTEGKVIAIMGPSVACVSQAGFRTFRQQHFYSKTQDGTAPVGLLRHGVRRARDLRGLAPGSRREAARDDHFTRLRPNELRGKCDTFGGKSPARGVRDKFAMPPDAIARAIAFAIEQPADVDVSEIVLHPIAQGLAPRL